MDHITITYYGPGFYCNRVYMAADLMGPSLEKAFGTYFHYPQSLANCSPRTVSESIYFT